MAFTLAYGWIELTDLQAYVRDHLAKAQTEALKPYWESITAAALRSGYSAIVRAFTARGFSKAQIDQWDDGAEFQRDIAAWFALQRMGLINSDSVSKQVLDTLDRRKELIGDKDTPATVLTIGGVVMSPESEYGQVHVGPMDTTDDLFVMPTADEDSRIGHLTRF